MKPSVADKLHDLGCLAVFLVVPALGYLVLSTRWEYAIPAVALVIGWRGYTKSRNKRAQVRHMALLREAFSTSGLTVPELHLGGAYGYPAFNLTFASEAAVVTAEEAGCIEAFKQAIQPVHAHVGGKERPFSADAAVRIYFKEGAEVSAYLPRRL